MSDLYTLVYVSAATQIFTESQLESLLIDACEKNRQNDLTGVLLYDEGNFIQCLEGPDVQLHQVYQRILASRRHTGVICLLDEPIEQRSFPDWQMGLIHTTRSETLRVSSAQWHRQAQADGSTDSSGMMLLKSFWKERGKVI